jgi:hypothetical protein
MVHDVLKLIMVVALLAAIIGLVTLFASGYISAFKPGGVVDNSKSPVGGGGTRSSGGGTNKSLMNNATMSAMSAGQRGAEQQEYAQQQQTGPESQQSYAPQPSYVQQPGTYIPQQPEPTVETGYTPTPEPSAIISPGTGNEGSVTPTASPSVQPGMPDMSEYIAGWQAAIDQFYRMLPYIFSRQLGFMPSWPAWPLDIKTM